MRNGIAFWGDAFLAFALRAESSVAASTGAAAQNARSGQIKHFGARAVQIEAPKSIIAEFQSCAFPAGAKARAASSSCAFVALCGNSMPSVTR
jgi:hypothetical protein